MAGVRAGIAWAFVIDLSIFWLHFGVYYNIVDIE